MYNKLSISPLEVINYYFKNGSLRKTAKEFNIHYQTLYKWVKMYRIIQNGAKGNGEVKEIIKEKLLTGYRRPWNRFPKKVEEKIIYLKEKEPGLTLKKAKEILEKEGIRISIKGIWGVWKRAGYAGFDRKKRTVNWIESVPWSKESKTKFEIAKYLFNKGKIKECVEILNSIQFLPKNELILKIPDRYLNLKRRIEKIDNMIGIASYDEVLKRCREIYPVLKKNNLKYSALRIGILETFALCWKGKPIEILRKIKELKKLNKDLPLELKFPLLISQGFAYIFLYEIKKAKEIAYRCKNIVLRKRNISPYFLIDLSTLFSNMEDYKYAEELAIKSLGKIDKKTEEQIKTFLFGTYISKGDFKKAILLSKSVSIERHTKEVGILLMKAILSLIKGNFDRAISYGIESLDFSRKEDMHNVLFNSSLILAGLYLGMNNQKRAKEILKNMLSICIKNKLSRGIYIIKLLLKQNLNLNKENLPSIHLILLLKNKKYTKAFLYAKKKNLLSFFYRYIIFFPDIINFAKNKGEIYLPKGILKLPVFNKDAFVFDVRFLGKLRVYRSWGLKNREKELLRLNLTPKEKAFLIHLALRLPEPERTISLEKIYKNFWKDSKKPERNLSYLLTKIRRQLKIPVHLLEISRRSGYPILKNNGIYFITDYLEFKEKIARAKALLKAEEYEFAKREFKSAFKLIRGRPFKKMYDRWSENKRTEILFKIEKAKEEFKEID